MSSNYTAFDYLVGVVVGAPEWKAYGRGFESHPGLNICAMSRSILFFVWMLNIYISIISMHFKYFGMNITRLVTRVQAFPVSFYSLFIYFIYYLLVCGTIPGMLRSRLTLLKSLTTFKNIKQIKSKGYL